MGGRIDELVRAMRADKLDVEENVPLAPLTTFRIGGNAAALVTARSPEEIARAVRAASDSGVPWAMLGGGSNVLVSDEGYPGLVILVTAARLRVDGLEVEAEAGVPLHRLAVSCAWAGLGGLTFVAGIPGMVGGAVCGNAGAWGRDVGERVVSVRVIRAGSLETIERSRSDLAFAYRTSALQTSGDVVLSARFLLEPGDRRDLLREIDNHVAERATKMPLLPSAGSFFRNLPPEHPAASGDPSPSSWMRSAPRAFGWGTPQYSSDTRT